MDTLAQLGVGLGALFVLWKLITPVTEAHIKALSSVSETLESAIAVMDAIRESVEQGHEDAAQRHEEILNRLESKRAG